MQRYSRTRRRILHNILEMLPIYLIGIALVVLIIHLMIITPTPGCKNGTHPEQCNPYNYEKYYRKENK